MSPRAAVRILTVLHTALGRWLEADQPLARKSKCSWFSLPPGILEVPRSAEELEAEEWDRAHFSPRPPRDPWK